MSALVKHSELTGADVHEPKGTDAAGAGEVFVADGAGSGSFQAVPPPGAGTVDHGATTGLTDDDHPQYLNEARHDALPADNPHGVTAVQVGADPAGAAAGAVASHEGSADPHTQYQTDARSLVQKNTLFYEVFDSSAQVLTGADAIIVMGNEESVNGEYSLSAGRATVNFTGRIKATYTMVADSTNGTRSVARTTLYLNAAAVIRSFADSYHRTTAAGESTATKSVLLTVSNGDIIDLRSRILSGSGITTLANGSNILIERIA